MTTEDAVRTIERALDRRSCHQCHGTGVVSVKAGQVSETDSAEEAELAYQTVACPSCTKHRADALAALEEIRKEWEQLKKDAAIPVVAPTRCQNCGHVDLKGNVDMAQLRYAVAWAYQAVGARWPNLEALDNLSAVHRGEVPPHEWPVVPPAEARVYQLQDEHDEAIRTRTLAQAASTRDLEAKRAAEEKLRLAMELIARLQGSDTL